MMTEEEALAEVKKLLGGNVGIAMKLGDITPQAVSQWKRIPPVRVPDIEAITGIPREQLRPDVFRKGVAA
jgi:DNA-binding transcriptional regulator YdaS (Cro superfamily)